MEKFHFTKREKLFLLLALLVLVFLFIRKLQFQIEHF